MTQPSPNPNLDSTLSDPTSRIEQRLDGLPSVSGQASLVQIYGDELGKRYPVEQELTLGRAITNDIVLDVENVSRHHALVFQREGDTFITDRGSTNGTFVNDDTLKGEIELTHGDLIKVGSAIFRFIGSDNAEAQYHEEIYRLAITDGLTGLRNRRYFNDFVEREVARSSRSRARLSLVLFDVDNFKKLNDDHGHLFGDRVLRELARGIATKVRREQLMARFGGDEFALVLPDVGLQGAVAFAERIRAVVADNVFREDDEETTVTLSLGVATLTQDLGPVELVQLADKALYDAKSSGRDRVMTLQKLQSVDKPSPPKR